MHVCSYRFGISLEEVSSGTSFTTIFVPPSSTDSLGNEGNQREMAFWGLSEA